MSNVQILVVEDEIIIARELEARLKGMGYKVPCIAASGKEALQLASEFRPDLVLMDIVLKGEMDGIDAAAEIRKSLQIPVIYLTAYTDVKTLERAKVTEPFGYIVKPFAERELRANIEMALYKHRAETRLRRIERWFSDAMEGLGDGVIAADTEGRIVSVNHAAEAITAWGAEQAIGRHMGEVLRLVDRKSGERIEWGGLSDGPVVCLGEDTLLLDRLDMPIPVDNTICLRRDDYDRPDGTIAVLRDPSKMRHGAVISLNADIAMAVAQAVSLEGMLQMCAESIVKNLNAAFARIWTTNTTQDMLVLQASAGMYTHLNGAHARIPVGELKIGRIAKSRVPHLTNDIPHDPEISDREWARREKLVAFAGYPLLVDDQVLGVMGLFSHSRLAPNTIDALATVAKSIAVGIERKRLSEQLRQSQKLEAIGLLAGGVAHDFNNLLTIISGYAELLMHKSEPDSEFQHFAMEIQGASGRAAALTRQLLAFSRKQVLEPRNLDLNRLVTGMSKMLGRLIGEDIILNTVIDPDLARTVADHGQIEQVLANLAVNARDAMPEGGSLTIETRNVHFDMPPAHFRGEIDPGPYVMVALSDTGCGMPPEVVDHIFEPFYTTKREGKGTGLGLSTVYGIVKQSGGHIVVYSELGVGTTFKLYFPSLDIPEAPAPSQPASNSDCSGSETIIVVEDDEPLRKLVKRILTGYGYAVYDLADGHSVLQFISSTTDPVHLLITDVVMPKLGGRQLAEAAGHIRRDLKVLYMSGYTDDAIVRHGVLQAEVAFLQKPFTADVLARKVRETLDAPPRPRRT